MARLVLLLILFSFPAGWAFVANSKTLRGIYKASSHRTVADVKQGKARRQRRQRPKPPVKDDHFQEFQWLNWVYCQWRSKEPGELDSMVLKQMMPAVARWGRRRTLEGANRAEELLERIIEENLAGNEAAELPLSLFNMAMDAYAKVGNPEGVQRILQRMQTLRKEHKNLAHLQPDVFSMSTLATAWAKSRSSEAAKRAEAILEYMEARGLTPNTITYNSVLSALASGREVDKALKSEDLVNRMKARSEKGEDCEPDIYSYQALIHAWSKTKLSGSPQKAERLLLFLDEEYQKGNKKLKPNSYCYTATIHAWARSHEDKKARNAYQIFNRMKKRYYESQSRDLKPNVVVLTAVLNACAWPSEGDDSGDAFEIAQLAMEELSLGVFDKPNFLSYAAFLSVCWTTLSAGEERDKIVRKTFERCIESGQVAGIVLEKLGSAASADLYHELVDSYRNKNGELELPRSWNANVKGERRGETLNVDRSNRNILSPSAKLRLREVEKYRGKTGAYSGEENDRPVADGIEWKEVTFGVQK